MKPKRPAPGAVASSGSTSPLIWGNWAAQARMKAPARLASKVAARRGLPMVRISDAITAVSIRSVASAAAASHATRWATVASWWAMNAAWAFLTAASTTDDPDSIISPAIVSSTGEISRENSPEAGCREPPIHGNRRGISFMGETPVGPINRCGRPISAPPLSTSHAPPWRRRQIRRATSVPAPPRPR